MDGDGVVGIELGEDEVSGVADGGGGRCRRLLRRRSQ